MEQRIEQADVQAAQGQQMHGAAVAPGGTQLARQPGTVADGQRPENRLLFSGRKQRLQPGGERRLASGGPQRQRRRRAGAGHPPRLHPRRPQPQQAGQNPQKLWPTPCDEGKNHRQKKIDERRERKRISQQIAGQKGQRTQNDFSTLPHPVKFSARYNIFS